MAGTHVATRFNRQVARRGLGCHYTPPYIARLMVDACLAHYSDAAADGPLILDPACGAGVFLLEAFDWLRQTRRELSPLDIVRRHLFGVDVDAHAIRTLRRNLFEIMAPGPSARVAAKQALRRNFRVGNALSGPDFATRDHRLHKLLKTRTPAALPLDFRRAFPQAVVRGGFDVVIGNPPYCRELNAATLFDQITRSPLGQRWREARMDLWYYFLHRGLDVLRPGGVLSFIVNSYWIKSSGAGKLIARLRDEATFEEFVLLGDKPIFANVAGRHHIFRLRKRQAETPCLVRDLSADERRFKRFPSACVAGPVYELSPAQLFQHGRIVLAQPVEWDVNGDSRRCLADVYHVRQGMAENPPAITARHVRLFGTRYRQGEGVFVLSDDEIERLGLSAAEEMLLRPYYRTASIGRYFVPNNPTGTVLYLTKETAPNVSPLPQIIRHLARFRPILQRRRETRQGKITWWQLHWPREERIFTVPRILSVQMGRVPQFVYVARPTYVGFAVNVILGRDSESRGDASAVIGPSLPALTGILNSAMAKEWFAAHAKQRGVNLEINGGTLGNFPLPAADADLDRQLTPLVLQRQELCAANGSARRIDDTAGDAERRRRIESQIDALVRRWYGIST